MLSSLQGYGRPWTDKILQPGHITPYTKPPSVSERACMNHIAHLLYIQVTLLAPHNGHQAILQDGVAKEKRMAHKQTAV